MTFFSFISRNVLSSFPHERLFLPIGPSSSSSSSASGRDETHRRADLGEYSDIYFSSFSQRPTAENCLSHFRNPGRFAERSGLIATSRRFSPLSPFTAPSRRRAPANRRFPAGLARSFRRRSGLEAGQPLNASSEARPDSPPGRVGNLPGRAGLSRRLARLSSITMGEMGRLTFEALGRAGGFLFLLRHLGCRRLSLSFPRVL